MLIRPSFVLGFAIGAGVMYFLDMRGGRRRRAIARDKAMHYLHSGEHLAWKKARHMRNRARGLFAERMTERRSFRKYGDAA
jgi:hypothetical protein